MLSISYSKPIVPAFAGVNFGICHAVSWAICVLLGGRAPGECQHPARYTLLIIPLLCKCLPVLTRSVDALQILCAHASCTIRMFFGQLLTMVFCLDVVSPYWLQCFVLYA